MTVSEWLDQFKAQNGRDPSPEEYQAAIASGEVVAPYQQNTASNDTSSRKRNFEEIIDSWPSHNEEVTLSDVENLKVEESLDWRQAMRKIAEEEEKKAKEANEVNKESSIDDEKISENPFPPVQTVTKKVGKKEVKNNRKRFNLLSRRSLTTLIVCVVLAMSALFLGLCLLLSGSSNQDAQIDTTAFVGNWTIDVMSLSNDDDDAIELQAGTVLTIEDKPNLSGVLTQNTLINEVEEASNYDDYIEKLSDLKKEDVMSYNEIKEYIKEKTGFTDIKTEYYIGNRAAFLVNNGQNMVVFLLPKETSKFYLYKKFTPDESLESVSGTWTVNRETNGQTYVIDNGRIVSVDGQETNSALIPLEEYTEKLQHFNELKNSDKAILYDSILEPILSNTGIEWTDNLKIFVDESRSYVQSSDTDLFIFDESGQTGYTLHFPLYSVQGIVSSISKTEQK